MHQCHHHFTRIFKLFLYLYVSVYGDTSMASQMIETERLHLRALQDDDVPYIIEYAGNKLISDNASRIPYPYTIDDAKTFLKMSNTGHETGNELIFGMISKSEGHLIGCIGLTIDRENDVGELGFWVGQPFWGRGLCTEAGRSVLDHAFRQLALNCVFAVHYPHNVGSAKVIEKLGMTYEGRQRQRLKKADLYMDLATHSILKSEYLWAWLIATMFEKLIFIKCCFSLSINK